MPEPAVTAALLTTAATTGGAIWREVRKARQLGERNNKLLEGIDDSDAYDGVVDQVQRHEEALDREGLLDGQTEG